MIGLTELCREITNDKRVSAAEKKRLFDKLITAPIFIIENNEASGESYSANTGFSEFALPFSYCYFEGIGNYLMGIYKSNIELGVRAMLVEEKFPNVYLCSYLIENLKTGEVGFATSVVGDDIASRIKKESIELGVREMGTTEEDFLNNQKKLSALISDQLSKILKRVHSSDYGKETTHRSLNLKSINGNYNYKPSTIIRIKSKSEAANSVSPVMRGRIEWLKCWWTRGHWRKNDGIGKNRNGDYCVQGMTWVKEHIKGDDTIEPKKKTYIV